MPVWKGSHVDIILIYFSDIVLMKICQHLLVMNIIVILSFIFCAKHGKVEEEVTVQSQVMQLCVTQITYCNWFSDVLQLVFHVMFKLHTGGACFKLWGDTVCSYLRPVRVQLYFCINTFEVTC